jgi:hypothetical protein
MFILIWTGNSTDGTASTTPLFACNAAQAANTHNSTGSQSVSLTLIPTAHTAAPKKLQTESNSNACKSATFHHEKLGFVGCKIKSSAT